MKTSWQKALSMLLVIMLAVGIMPTVAFAAALEIPYIKFILSPDEKSIVGYEFRVNEDRDGEDLDGFEADGTARIYGKVNVSGPSIQYDIPRPASGIYNVVGDYTLFSGTFTSPLTEKGFYSISFVTGTGIGSHSSGIRALGYDLTGSTIIIDNTKPKIGDTLTASYSLTEDLNNGYSSISCSWYAGSKFLASSSLPKTSTTGTIQYTVTAETVGYPITCTINCMYPFAEITSAPTDRVKDPSEPDSTITITSQPSGATITEGDTLNLSVAASVTENATLSYQWQKSTTSASAGFSDISGATNATVNADTDAAGTYYYRCVVSATGAVSVTSSTAKVVVNPATPPVAQTATPGVTSADPINLDMGGVKTAYIGVSLGTSGSGVKAGQATATVVTGDAVTVSPATLNNNGNITVTAVKTGTATVNIAFTGGDVTDDAYNTSITVNVTGGTVTPPPTPTPTPSGDSGSSSGGGTSSNVSAAPAPVTQSTAVNETQKAIAEAKKSGSGTADVRLKNVSDISLNTMKSVSQAAGSTPVKLNADSMNGNAVDVRITIDPAKASKNINLSASTTSQAAKSAEAKFNKYYDNNVSVVSLSQKGDFGMPVEIAAKVDKKLNLETLVFYSYDKATNSYKPITDAKYWVDKNGYVHFTTTLAGDIIISDKPLVKK